MHELLSRLHGLQSTGEHTWRAFCPAHAGRRKALSIRQKDDGTLLIHCFHGCDPLSVVQAVGLRLADLGLGVDGPAKAEYARMGQWRAALDTLCHEALVLQFALRDTLTGTATHETLSRVVEAGNRLYEARQALNPRRKRR